MQEFASRALSFMRMRVTRQVKPSVWLSEFILLFYASLYLRTTSCLVSFIALRFKLEYRWNRPWFFMLTVMRSLNPKKFGIVGIRIGFHGKFGGRERAYRFYTVLGANPCLRNNHLTGSYSTKQCTSKYGITHVHMWLTYF
jgi:hypothetical protein